MGRSELLIMDNIESLCRVEIEDKLFYCVDCCRDDAYLICKKEFFGTLEDGTLGCLAYDNKPKTLHDISICDTFACWDPEKLSLPEVQKALAKHFSEKSGGMHHSREALDIINKVNPTK